MNNLTLQQMEKLGISKWMNEKERDKALESQQKFLDSPQPDNKPTK